MNELIEIAAAGGCMGMAWWHGGGKDKFERRRSFKKFRETKRTLEREQFSPATCPPGWRWEKLPPDENGHCFTRIWVKGFVVAVSEDGEALHVLISPVLPASDCAPAEFSQGWAGQGAATVKIDERLFNAGARQFHFLREENQHHFDAFRAARGTGHQVEFAGLVVNGDDPDWLERDGDGQLVKSAVPQFERFDCNPSACPLVFRIESIQS